MPAHLFAFARIEPKKRHHNQALHAIRSISARTRAEPGCHRFDLLCGDDDGCLYLYEEWEDEAALAEHYEQPYTREVFAAYGEWLRKPVEVIRLRPVDRGAE